MELHIEYDGGNEALESRMRSLKLEEVSSRDKSYLGHVYDDLEKVTRVLRSLRSFPSECYKFFLLDSGRLVSEGNYLGNYRIEMISGLEIGGLCLTYLSGGSYECVRDDI